MQYNAYNQRAQQAPQAWVLCASRMKRYHDMIVAIFATRFSNRYVGYMTELLSSTQ